MTPSNSSSSSDSEQRFENQRERFAEAFDREIDPLAEYSETFEQLPDPFRYYLERVIANRDQISKDGTIEDYERTYRQFQSYMQTTDRHPACPTVQQVKNYIGWRRDVHNNAPSTIKIKFGRLKGAYEYWQMESVFPHPPDYNPFAIAMEEASLGEEDGKPFPELTLDEVRQEFNSISNIRYRAVVGIQLKCGLRAGELSNLQLQDIHLAHSDLQSCYPQLGTHEALGDYENVIYVSPNREGNKSSVPRLVPIDQELFWLLLTHLLLRPQVDRPWVFLTERGFGQMGYTAINRPWTRAFQPKYAETESTRAITSHFGRHWFSSHFRLEAEFPREHVQYMRGDRIEPEDEFAGVIDDYLHPHYEHIETAYRNDVFQLGVSPNSLGG